MEEITIPRGSSPADSSLRELQVAHEIAHAFLTSDAPGDVYSLALQRVAPLLGATFGCVYLREEDDVLRLVAAYNWPQSHARHLDAMRVRVGSEHGPTGQAVAENRIVEVFDIYNDPQLSDWQEVAEELGFAASVSLPLVTSSRPDGAITFYFRDPERLRENDRSLLRLVADQLAAAAEKAHLIENLRVANTLLRDQNVELEARYRDAEEARRLKNEFLANVSHELRTPLTAILGFTYLLREGVSGELEGEQALAVEKIEMSGTELLGLINDLLDLTNLKLGRTTIEPETCDAAALSRASIAGLPPVPAGVLLHDEAPAEPISVHTDPSHVVRILRHLLSNALKFTREGTVTVRVRRIDITPGSAAGEEGRRRPRPLVVWEVQDTGIGIASADHERIFDEFRQVDGSATRRYGGTGMGLALSRQLARLLGGDLTVRSLPDVGSTFTLALPLRLDRP